MMYEHSFFRRHSKSGLVCMRVRHSVYAYRSQHCAYALMYDCRSHSKRIVIVRVHIHMNLIKISAERKRQGKCRKKWKGYTVIVKCLFRCRCVYTILRYRNMCVRVHITSLSKGTVISLALNYQKEKVLKTDEKCWKWKNSTFPFLSSAASFSPPLTLSSTLKWWHIGSSFDTSILEWNSKINGK